MKVRQIIPFTVLSTVITSTPAFAEKPTGKEIRGAGVFTGSAVVGGLVGGPTGMVLGATIGSLFFEKNEQTKELKITLAKQALELDRAIQYTQAKDKKIENLKTRVAQKLEFQVLFKTGSDNVYEEDSKRLEALVSYLTKNPTLNVRVDGHADSRGTDEYNNVLSAERAQNVADKLIELGMEANRIKVFSHGSSFSKSENKTVDQLALERRVHIEVYADDSKNLASSNNF